jgi:hypothetical protein
MVVHIQSQLTLQSISSSPQAIGVVAYPVAGAACGHVVASELAAPATQLQHVKEALGHLLRLVEDAEATCVLHLARRSNL